MPRAVASVRRSAAFTLTELLIAVGVLVVVITAAAKIFSASSKVAAVAEANADLIQTATAIESQIRADFANIPKNSFMVIQQVEVNAFGQTQTPTVDPSLGTAEIRADQIAFFTRGVRQTTQYTGSQESNSSNGVATTWTAESAVARIYYGHGVIAPSLPLSTGPFSYENSNASVVPWKGGRVELERWTDGASQGVGNIPLTRASNWPLVRLSTLLASDGLPTTVDGAGAATNTTLPVYGAASVNASVSLFANRAIRLNPLATKYPNTYAPLWTSGRVDIVKWQPDDLFSQMAFQSDAQQGIQGIPFIRQPFGSPWGGPSSRLRMIQTLANWAAPATTATQGNGANELFVSYPRVEKAAPSSAKADVMLTAPVLAPNCSSFKVEWTWAHGVGRSFGGSSSGNPPQGGESIGMFIRTGTPVPAQPWFGMDRLIATPTELVRDIGGSSVRTISNSPNFLDNGFVGDWGTIGLPLVVGNSGADLICSAEGPMNRNGDALVAGSPIWRCS
ncbi:MAG: hypothetical protein RIS45_746, partial [Planctomycetota bacterium]